MNSLQSNIDRLSKTMGELGIIDGAEVKTLAKLQDQLSKREDFVQEVGSASGSGRERRLNIDDIRSIIQTRNMAVSFAKIGVQHGIVGMMVSNICKGNIYKDLVAQVATEGVVLTYFGK